MSDPEKILAWVQLILAIAEAVQMSIGKLIELARNAGADDEMLLEIQRGYAERIARAKRDAGQ